MRSLLLIITIFTTNIAITNYCLAKTNSYFTVTGDRVMINLRSGYGFSEEADRDAEVLFRDIEAPLENSVMGQGKKLTLSESFTLIAADRGKGQYDGTIMVTPAEGIIIHPQAKSVEVRWVGEKAQIMKGHWGDKNRDYHYQSFDGKLQIQSRESEFSLSYKEQNPADQRVNF